MSRGKRKMDSNEDIKQTEAKKIQPTSQEDESSKQPEKNTILDEKVCKKLFWTSLILAGTSLFISVLSMIICIHLSSTPAKLDETQMNKIINTIKSQPSQQHKISSSKTQVGSSHKKKHKKWSIKRMFHRDKK